MLVFAMKDHANVENAGVEAPPKQVMYWRRAILWHSLGFMTILILTWCDSMFDLVHRLFGAPAERVEDFNETAVKLVVIVLLWIFSAYKLYKIVSRLNYLEKFLHVCAWCRRIEYENSWFSLEDHFRKQTGGQTTHGICPQCAKRVMGSGSLAHTSS
jgi:hypothetical protein